MFWIVGQRCARLYPYPKFPELAKVPRMNSPQSVPASNDDDYRAPEKALAVYRDYQLAVAELETHPST